MIKVTICDDRFAEQQNALILVKEYSESVQPLDIHQFSSAVTLRDNLTVIQETDIFLLDIVMPDLSGIELGKYIRLNHPTAHIIYFTTSPDFALDAYGIQALQYLIKPIDKQTLFDALNKAIILSSKKDCYYAVHTKKELVPVKVNEIRFIEYMDHFLFFHMHDRVISSRFIRVAFNVAVKELFENSQFILPHQSYLINLSHILKMERNSFVMDDNTIIPIAKNRLIHVRQSYMNYVLRGRSNG